MMTFCITSWAWLTRAERVCALVCRALDGNADLAASILIDNAAVSREQDSCTPTQLGLIEIDLRDWVTESLTEGGIINVGAIRRRALVFSPDDTVVIVATGFLPAIILKALEHLRLGFFSADTWPRAIAVACDDAMMYQIMPALTHAFYLRPAILVENAIDRHTRHLIRRANVLRRFGARLGAFAALVQGLINRSHAKVERKIAKKHDWIWEE